MTESPEPTESVDAIILGSGQAGNPLADALSKAGKKTVVIEANHVGGTCVNEGCTPTKTMISSAEVANKVHRGPEYGIHSDHFSVNMTEVRARKRNIVNVWRTGSEKRLAEAKNVELVRGLGRFTSPNSVEVTLTEGGTRTFTASLIFINTGLSSITPPLDGIETVPYLTNESVMELDEVPGHLLILGGSYIAVEFAQMFRRFGSQVTIVSTSAQLLPREDPDIADELRKIFEEDGIHLVLGAKATAARVENRAITLTFTRHNQADQTTQSDQDLTGTHLLLAAGRKPNTFALNLAAAGVEMDDHGFIRTNERLETNVPGIYALGDVKGGPAFTHISYDDYRIIAANLLEGGHRSTLDRPVPYTVFTDPELGRIGITEQEAKQSGLNYRIAIMPATSIARAYETGNAGGLVKVIVDRDSEQILGAAILAGEGGELAAMLQIAMAGKLPYTALRDAVFAHPTWAESLNNIFFHWRDES